MGARCFEGFSPPRIPSSPPPDSQPYVQIFRWSKAERAGHHSDKALLQGGRDSSGALDYLAGVNSLREAKVHFVHPRLRQQAFLWHFRDTKEGEKMSEPVEAAPPAATTTSQYDLTRTISKYLDLHMMFPLLDFVEMSSIYPANQVAQARLDLLDATNMVRVSCSFLSYPCGVDRRLPVLLAARHPALEVLGFIVEYVEQPYRAYERTQIQMGKWHLSSAR